MVQEFSPLKSHASYLSEALAPSLGQGLGNFMGNYLVNKSLQGVLNDPNLKNAPLSERQMALQNALAPHGERGMKFFDRTLAIEGQRQQEQALQKLKELNVEGKTPQEIVATYYEALQGHPRAGEIISSVLPYVLSKTTAAQTGEGLSNAAQYLGMGKNEPTQVNPPYKIGAETPTQSPVKTTPITPSQKLPDVPKRATSDQISNYTDQYLKEFRPDLLGQSPYGNVPTFDFQSKSDLRPEEEGRIRQKLTKDGVLPQVQEQIVNRLREDIQTKYNEQKDRYNISKDQQNAIDNKWATFRADAIGNQEKPGRLSPYLNQFQTPDGDPMMNTQQDLMNKYFQYAEKLPVNLNPDAMHAQTMTLLQNDINRLNNLKSLPGMPPIRSIGDVEHYIETNKDAVKDLISEGFIESVKEDFLYNKDMGIEETHKAIWGDQTSKKSLNDVYNVKPRIVPSKIGELPAIPGAFGEFKVAPGDDQNYTNNLSKVLRNIKPDDDLILLRSQVLANGGNEKHFLDALKIAQENGLSLSPFQNTQLQEVRIPRQRPIWEYFTPQGWSALYNYIRGKR